MLVGEYKLAVVVDGEELPVKQRDGRNYVEGQLGKRYELKLAGPAGDATFAVVSVDGINTVSGVTASKHGGTGYLLPELGELTVPGFKVDDEECARFRFGERAAAYAAVLGRPENIGVIGAAFYPAALPKPTPALEHDMGTIFGERAPHPTYNTSFQTGALACQIEIEYASLPRLEAAGIDGKSTLERVRAFPSRRKGREPLNCAPPEGWEDSGNS